MANKTAWNLCLLRQALMPYFVSKASPSIYNYIRLICNSIIVFGINSACNAGMKNVIVLSCALHYILHALLALLIPNTTTNHTITYTNYFMLLLKLFITYTVCTGVYL